MAGGGGGSSGGASGSSASTGSFDPQMFAQAMQMFQDNRQQSPAATSPALPVAEAPRVDFNSLLASLMARQGNLADMRSRRYER